MGEDINGTKIFAFRVRDFIALFILFTSLIYGNNFVGGTPNQTATAVESQTEQLIERLDVFNEKLSAFGDLASSNEEAIKGVKGDMQRFDARMDTVYKMLINIDGYYRDSVDGAR